MKSLVSVLVIFGIHFLITGCETTTSRPYTPSTENILLMQETLANGSEGVRLGDFTQDDNIGSLTCRLNGPVDVSPGKTQAQFVKEALQSELFMAQVYDVSSKREIKGALNDLTFSSVSPANWKINFTVSSDKSEGFTVETTYPFKTSFSAYGACKNVAEAFAPAVQMLISDILKDPRFTELVRK